MFEPVPMCTSSKKYCLLLLTANYYYCLLTTLLLLLFAQVDVPSSMVKHVHSSGCSLEEDALIMRCECALRMHIRGGERTGSLAWARSRR